MGRLDILGVTRERRRGRTWSLLALLTGALSLSVGACTTSVDPSPAASVLLLPQNDSIEVGGVITSFVATALDSKGREVTGAKVTWRILNPDIATVDASGKVTTLKIGNTRLTAIVDGQPSPAAVVNVISKVARLLVVPDSIDVNIGTQKNVNAAVFDGAGSAIPGRVVSWSSANPLVAAVAPGGIISAVSVGETTVTATVGDLHAVVKVRIIPERVVSTKITNPLTGSHILRLTQTLAAAASCLNNANQVLPGRTITWTSQNPAIASVNSSTGLITALAVGQTQIAATCEGTQDAIQLQVTQIPVSSVAISPNPLTLFVGDNSQLAAVPKDSVGNVLSTLGRSVTWTTSNQTVASVNQNGVLNAVGAGTTNIQVIIDQVPSAVLPVTVNLKPVVSVTISPNSPQLKLSPPNAVLSVQLQATMRDVDGNVLGNRPVTWTSSNTSIATVSANGQVQAVAPGQVTITATSEGVPGQTVVTVIP